jgi:hypothetical protein
VSRLGDLDLAAAGTTPARAYGVLAASMQARGYLKARDATLALARSRLREEPPLRSLASRASIAARVYLNSLRPLGRPVARMVRSMVHKVRRRAETAD